ncbi:MULTISPECIES: LysR family transcriptional regulator [Vibrio]|uniref:LysR family transcriptional regulator n=4 Tax=Vibrio TaxID=662 RepID=A0A7Z1MEQ1_9VIBR|nr:MULTISPECIES: LysR family transcriptional regulator [Vibrio]ACZ71241.1 alginate lyase [Vibrio sp. AL14]KNH11542.1 LysR family transcriptional regulator [Vibrio lentus]MBY7659476.1 LysR family transcriptional regulator [Vibrio atlanticus]ERM58287.1 Transcriptional regulator, LysR family [Vibrio cyclitrophicus FF75]KAA8602702.1 Transcriptional regulator LysR family [Vibrio cyclitrophicus]|tara:strand:+ start:225 stop:1106 length:882 start_codon:yes stop_codon:yes gene_type:complete
MLTRSDDLEMVLTVVDAGGFSAAAEALDVQVAKVSRSVSKVESQLGVSIFNRTTRRVELTEEGRQFVDSVRLGLQVIQSAEEEIVSRGELPKGRLRVDAASPFVFHQLVPLVQSFKEAYPDIELELTSNEGFVDLLEKRTDVAIRIGKLSDSTLHARPLGKSLLHIVASPDYLAKRGLPTKPEDLSSHQVVGFAGNKVLNHWPLPNQSYIPPTVTASNGEIVRQLALAGNGIACLSGFMVQDDIAAGRLVPILEQDKLANTDRERVNAVYYKSSSVSKRISAFIDFIQPRLKL